MSSACRHRYLPPPERCPRARRPGPGHHGPPDRCRTGHRRGPRSPRRPDVDPRRGRGTPKFSTDVVTGMFISMMFAGHHTTSGTAAWTLIELLRHPEALARGDRRARRPLRQRGGGELPGAAGHAAARIGHQGGSAPASSAHPGAPGGEGGTRGRGFPDRRRASWWEPAWPCPTACPRISPTPTPSSPSAISNPGPKTGSTRGHGSPSAPAGTAAWGALRHDAAEGHLLGPAPRTGTSNWPSRRTPTATTIPRWSSSSSSPVPCTPVGALTVRTHAGMSGSRR